jgi:peroxiredoxin
MPLEAVLFLSVVFASLGFAVAALILLVWALIGRRGDPRKRRLRFAVSSVALSVASVATAISMFQLVFPARGMRAMQPDFQPPYDWGSKFLSFAVPILFYATAILLIRAIHRSQAPGTGKRAYLAPFGCLLLALLGYSTGYYLIRHVQDLAFVRHLYIENREWLTHVGDPAPDISVTMLDGSTKRLSDLRGKVVLVNFFATWCGPCNYELPHLEKLWHDFKDNDRFAMLVIDREETAEVVTPFLSKHKFTFPVALDPSAIVFKQFAKDGIPRTYLIGRDGTILFQTLGFSDDLPIYQQELVTLRETIDSELASAP